MNNIRLKCCGNHSLQDFESSIKSGADYIGVVFAESKRKVQPRKLKKWLKEIPLQDHQKLVGVFVNPSVEELEWVLQYVNIDILQMHGNETVPQLLYFREITNKPMWKAIHHNEHALELMKIYDGIIDGYVVDTKHGHQWGGTGKRFDWEHVPSYLKEAEKQHVPCFIAGGINPENVGELLPYNPNGVDVSSGIESNGAKDYDKISKITERLKINAKTST